MSNLRQIGAEGEEAAAQFLQRQGYSILERNFATRYGEMDIVAREGNTLAFVEVKLRRSLEFGLAQQAVNRAKMKRVGRMALAYLMRKRLSGVNCRFDVVAIQPSPNGDFSIELFRDAFVPPLRLP